MKIGVYWFRKALRLHDNLGLLRACSECDIVYPLFILDPAFTTKQSNEKASGASLPSKTVFKFFFETLFDLNRSLSSQKYKSNLIVIRGKPTDVYPKIFQTLKITDLFFETDTEPYAKQRDNTIIDLCSKHKIRVHTDYGHTLYPPQFLITEAHKMNKEIPTTYRGFMNLLKQAKDPQKPQAAPLAAIPGGKATRALFADKQFQQEMHRISKIKQYAFSIPTLKQLPYDNDTDHNHKLNDYEIDTVNDTFIGGESHALQSMQQYLQNKSQICRFEKPKTSPNSLHASTSTLSMYLSTGSLSVRLLWHEIHKIYKASKSGYSKPPISLHGQLYFREWFYLLSSEVHNFHQMSGNKMCKQIEWNPYDAQKVMKWKLGQTGYPFIDALMIQLRRTGWIHHLGRHAVACFLTRGDLWQSWQVGMDIFAEYLLDGDYALNAANWLWLSASAFFTAYFRVYSPIQFGKKTDKNGDFIRYWIPKLRHYDAKYIYEPWKAPKALQQQWNCVIGENYPEPMVDHKQAKAGNLKKMKIAYDAHKRNKNQKVAGKKRKRSWA